MKKALLCLLLLQLVTASFSQQPDPAKSFSREALLKKRSQQNTAAHVMLWGGLAAIITGTTIDQSVNFDGPRGWFGTRTRGTDKYQHTGAFIACTGFASVLGSIPFFFLAAKNRNKAMQLSLKNETIPAMAKQGIVRHPVPSLSLKIKL